jgi:hypothetical protein
MRKGGEMVGEIGGREGKGREEGEGEERDKWIQIDSLIEYTRRGEDMTESEVM